jgi:hypothetical protein
MNKTIFIAAMLAVATVLAAGLTVLPSSVQEAQADPCSAESSPSLVSSDNEGAGAGAQTVTSPPIEVGEQNCKFIGNDFDIDSSTDFDID